MVHISMLLSFKILMHLSIGLRLDCLQTFGFQDLNNFESDPEEFARTSLSVSPLITKGLRSSFRISTGPETSSLAARKQLCPMVMRYHQH
jgi:hypothetical protein